MQKKIATAVFEFEDEDSEPSTAEVRREADDITPGDWDQSRAKKAAELTAFVAQAEADRIAERDAEMQKWAEYRDELRRQANEKRKRRVLMVNGRGEVVGDWPSRKEAAKSLGIAPTTISNSICNRTWAQSGLRFINSDEFVPPKKKTPRVLPIRCVTDGREFPSVANAIGIQETEKKYRSVHKRLLYCIRKRLLFRGKLYEFIPKAELFGRTPRPVGPDGQADRVQNQREVVTVQRRSVAKELVDGGRGNRLPVRAGRQRMGQLVA
jgi:hypothetical protein